MGTRSLAEAVIMQSISDLWKEDARDESINFFEGEGFVKYAAVAGMGFKDRLRLIKIIAPFLMKREKQQRARRRHHVEIPVRAI